jgi:hypothetical protein
VLDIYRDIKPFSFSSVQASNIKNSSYPTSREMGCGKKFYPMTAVDPVLGFSLHKLPNAPKSIYPV